MTKKNILITGPPKSGKTTAINNIIQLLRSRNIVLAGIMCPEIIRDGIRYGFKIIDIKSGREGILASINEEKGPRVSKYRVNIPNLEEIGVKAIETALSDDSQVIVIDEIGKMELLSQKFARVVIKALDSRKPVLGIIAFRSFNPIIKRIKSRKDVLLYTLSRKMNQTARIKIINEITNRLLFLVRDQNEKNDQAMGGQYRAMR